MITKEKALLEQCVLPYHNLFQNQMAKTLVENHYRTFESLALKLLEEAMAHASDGLYQWVDEDTNDFSDKSDAKTGTCSPNLSRATGGRVKIDGLVTQAGVEKAGALRVVIFNTCKDGRLDFLCIPKYAWQNRVHICSLNNRGRMNIHYSELKHSYGWADLYRYDSFISMVKSEGKTNRYGRL